MIIYIRKGLDSKTYDVKIEGKISVFSTYCENNSNYFNETLNMCKVSQVIKIMQGIFKTLKMNFFFNFDIVSLN